jgi:dGTPase
MKRKPYDDLISGVRHRTSRVKDRTLEEEADADRGRVLFCAPFRRLQNKAQVFSLESNAAVRSRLTHSLEVSSIGRLVAQQAIKMFSPEELDALGITGKERPLLTFVETACLLHDLGNPPFGHFGEIDGIRTKTSGDLYVSC